MASRGPLLPAGSARPRFASPVVLAALATGFAVVASLEASGVLSGIDQFAVSHLMPAYRPRPTDTGGVLSGLYRPFGSHTSWWEICLNLWTYPCSVLVSGVLVAGCGLVVARRMGVAAGAAPVAAWLAGNAIELLGKHYLHRPPLYGRLDGVRVHAASFDNSFPSGHTIRGTVVAYALILAWPAVRSFVLGWVALVYPFLVVSANHTPSDVVGGLLAGLFVVGTAGALAARAPLAAAGFGGSRRARDPEERRRGEGARASMGDQAAEGR